MRNDEIEQLVAYCQTSLDVAGIPPASGAAYPSVPLCVIDTVYSISARYTSTENTVKRFMAYFNVTDRLSINDLLGFYEKYPLEFMTRQVYQNAQRTSTKNGILKAEAVLRVAEVLHKYQVNTLDDVHKIINNPAFEADYKSIPGQGSGVSLRYLYMLVGVETEIKPDRMVIRFIEAALNRTVYMEECHALLVSACEILRKDYADLTPRNLDHAIWQFQRLQ